MMFQPFPFSFWRPSSEAANPYQILVKTDNAGTSLTNQFTLPATGTYDVDWGDGVTQTGLTGSQTHTFPAPGNYVIKLTGGLTAITFNNGGDKLKLLEIQNWGDIAWSTFANAYYGCSNVTSVPDNPNWDSVTTMSNAFRGCSLTSWTVDLPASLTHCSSAWQNNSLTSWTVDLPASLINCASAWRSSSLTSWTGGGSWAGVTDATSCLVSNTINTDDYSNLLILIESTNSNPNVFFHGGNSLYNVAGGVARAALVADHTWTITDGGPA